jgi:hypothetical protein
MVAAHYWRCVLIPPRSKRAAVDPSTGGHLKAEGVEQIRHWVTRRDGNVGVYAGTSGKPHLVLDFDEPGALAEMAAELGPLPPTVETGSGKVHVYLRWEPDVTASILWRGKHVGEILRLDTQYTVAPPSIHPDTGRPYRWLVDPRVDRLSDLPRTWREYLRSGLPDFIRSTDDHGQPTWEEPWEGPPPEEMIAAALRQPGARRYRGGAKFQCPECAWEGHDRHRDNAVIWPDGRWGCAYAPGDAAHRRAIGAALGVAIGTARSSALRGLGGLRGLRGL